MGLSDLRALARERMPAEAWHHFNGAAETKATFYRNPRAFQKYLFRQRIFHDVTEPDISIELFGRTLPIPAITAPVGSFSLIGKETEREVAEGTANVGAMMFTSQAAKFDPKGWRQAAKSPLVFMAYMNRGKEEVSEYAKTAQDLDFAAVGITMDTVKPVKIGDEVPMSTKDGKPRKGHKSTLKDIEWLKQQVNLPVVVKGIMGADDARSAVNAGADAVVVSNHGGQDSRLQPSGAGGAAGSRRGGRRQSAGDTRQRCAQRRRYRKSAGAWRHGDTCGPSGGLGRSGLRRAWRRTGVSRFSKKR